MTPDASENQLNMTALSCPRSGTSNPRDGLHGVTLDSKTRPGTVLIRSPACLAACMNCWIEPALQRLRRTRLNLSPQKCKQAGCQSGSRVNIMFRAICPWTFSLRKMPVEIIYAPYSDPASGLAGKFGNVERSCGFQITLAAKPVFHGCRQFRKRHAKPCFEQTIAHRQGIVEDGIIGEVPHGEIINPMDGASVSLPRVIEIFDFQFTQKHGNVLCASNGPGGLPAPRRERANPGLPML